MPLTNEEKKAYQKEYMRKKRGLTRSNKANVRPTPTGLIGSNTKGLTKEGSNKVGLTPAPGRLFTPSKFLSEEEDLKLEARVREALKTMSGSRLASFKALANAFTPNKVKDPSLKVPELT